MTSIVPSTAAQGGLPPTVDAARAVGRQLALETRTAEMSAGPCHVETLVLTGLQRLARYGVHAELVRSRPNCVVVRSMPRSGAAGSGERGCVLMTAWLETLPQLAHKVTGSVVEASCATRGSNACIHTLLWQEPAALAPAPDGSTALTAAPSPSPSPAPAPAPAHVPPTATLSPSPSPAHDQRSPGGPAAVGAPSPSPAAPQIPTPPSPAAPQTTAAASPAVPPTPAPQTPEASAPQTPEAPSTAAAASTPSATTGDPSPGSALPVLAGSWVQRANGAFRAAFGALGSRLRDDDVALEDEEEAAAAPGGGHGELERRRPTDGRYTGPERRRPLLAIDAPAPSSAASTALELAGFPDGALEGPVAAERQPSDADVTEEPAARPRARRRGRGRSRRGWLRRRWWMLALAGVMGAGGGYAATAHHAASYSATTVLVVRSGASPSGPGSANDASALAVTDAALLGSDQSVIAQVASDLHLPKATVAKGLDVQAVAGTSLMDLKFSAASSSQAIKGARDVASVLVDGGTADQAIPSGSLAVVSLPTTASSSGKGLKKGLPLGVVLGLMAGAAAVLAAERADRRIDDVDTLSAATDCPVTAVPGGISPIELARSLDRVSDAGTVALVPLRRQQADAAQQLAHELAGARVPVGSGDGGARMTVTRPFAEAPDAVSTGEGPTVLVVGSGERLRVVNEVVARLRLVERQPVWSVLVTGG